MRYGTYTKIVFADFIGLALIMLTVLFPVLEGKAIRIYPLYYEPNDPSVYSLHLMREIYSLIWLLAILHAVLLLIREKTLSIVTKASVIITSLLFIRIVAGANISGKYGVIGNLEITERLSPSIGLWLTIIGTMILVSSLALHVTLILRKKMR